MKVKEKGANLWNDFKKFAFKGNIIDMAVGVIVGGAFGKIVTSIVNDVVMPFFGYIMAGTDFKSLKWILSPAVLAEDGVTVVKPESAILYGNFIQNVIDFLIIALCIFFFLKLITVARKRLEKEKEEEAAAAAAAEPAKPTEADLLTEIRDLLKAQNGVVDETPTEESAE